MEERQLTYGLSHVASIDCSLSPIVGPATMLVLTLRLQTQRVHSSKKNRAPTRTQEQYEPEARDRLTSYRVKLKERSEAVDGMYGSARSLS